MNIREKECDKKLALKKFEFSVDEADKTIPEPLPRKSFFMLIAGRPGSGKSTLLLNLLTKKGRMFYRKFDKIYLFSPSLKSMKGNPFKSIPENQKFEDLTIENMESAITGIEDSGDKVLFVLDDVVADMGKNAILNNYLMKLLFNRRHLCGEGGSTSWIITTQGFVRIPAPIRKTASHLILYHTRNRKELDTIFDETILLKKSEYYDILNYVFDKKHNFIFIDLDKKLEDMFYKNFNQLSFNCECGDVI